MAHINDIKIIHSHKQVDNLPLGWLLPDKFIEVRWGKHEKWAGEYIIQNDLLQENNEFENKCFSALSKDFLICCKNFILLHDPCDCGELFIGYNSLVKPTKFQKDFIFDLLLKIQDADAMKKFMEYLE